MPNKFTRLAILAIASGLFTPAHADDHKERHHDRESSKQHTQRLSIGKARWDAKSSRLILKGKAEKNTGITVRDGDTLSVIRQTISNHDGKWRIRIGMEKPPCTVQAVSNGQTVARHVRNARGYCDATAGNGGSGGNSGGGGSGTGATPAGDYVTIASNDLGMHCADLDYQIFSILPPYNVVHSQVIRKGAKPDIVDNLQIDLYYTAEPNPSNTLPPDVITTTSRNIDGLFKSNFWNSGLGKMAYDPLYPAGVLDMFQIPPDTGLPAPNVERLYLGDGQLEAHQQEMPGPFNTARPFHGYVRNFPFFNSLPFGYVAGQLDRFTAEGVPILPVADPDPQGRLLESPYPLMKVTAVAKGKDPAVAGNQLSSVRVVLPIASEADCQLCHLDQEICQQSQLTAGQSCNGEAASFASTDFDVITLDTLASVPGETEYQIVLNASKINILRLHDAKHGTTLDQQRKVVCASCHYSTALDLAQFGPSDDNNKEQRQHISMSRAMHGYHGQFTDLFPDMPSPVGRDMNLAQEIVGQTCYACHPGKRTQCLRGAMTQAGIVCQDCHGNMRQVGDDFSANLVHNTPGSGDAWTNNADWSRRVPWASEPRCQSCHTGDAVSSLAGNPDVIPADDGIRLLQAYRKGDSTATPIEAVNRRFAETRDSLGKDHLYRLSKGHGGVMCEGCHGSTHAVWPNPWDASNDNLAAKDLQGHAGVLIECNTCHGDNDLGVTLDGPHGMHPVGSVTWNKKHEDIAEKNPTQCKSCHGVNGEGTVLSRARADRDLICKDGKGSLCSGKGQRITVPAGTEISCTLCHENKINGD